jgi:hypothetical protein
MERRRPRHQQTAFTSRTAWGIGIAFTSRPDPDIFGKGEERRGEAM